MENLSETYLSDILLDRFDYKSDEVFITVKELMRGKEFLIVILKQGCCHPTRGTAYPCKKCVNKPHRKQQT